MLFVEDEDSENLRVKIDLEAPQDDSSLASLIATYSKDPKQWWQIKELVACNNVIEMGPTKEYIDMFTFLLHFVVSFVDCIYFLFGRTPVNRIFPFLVVTHAYINEFSRQCDGPRLV